MKQPYEINSDFFKKMISSGWYPERDIVFEKLPSHIEDLPSVVKKFLREIWYISVTKDFYMQDNYKKYIFSNDVYTFGETTQKLIDYSSEEESSYFCTYLTNKKIRNFGFKSGREILIDESGGIYEIPDSGDIYYVGGKFYEGLYNLIFTRGTSYLINDTGSLFIESKEGLISANINIEDII
jgi:hypothetical protein